MSDQTTDSLATSAPGISSAGSARTVSSAGGGFRAFSAGVLGGFVAVGISASGLLVFGAPLLTKLAPDFDKRLQAQDLQVTTLGEQVSALRVMVASRLGVQIQPTTTAQAQAQTTASQTGQPPAAQAGTAAADPQADRRLAQIGQRLDDVQGQVDTLRKSIPAEGTILRLIERTDQVELKTRALLTQHGQAQAQLLLLGLLRDAVNRGDGFGGELAALRHVATADMTAQLDKIAPAADGGVRRRDQLLADVPGLADQLGALALVPQGDSWYGRILAQLAGMIHLRRIDGQGDAPAALLKQAEDTARTGRFEETIALLDRYAALPVATPADSTDKPVAAIVPAELSHWLEAARARQTTDRTLATLSTTLLSATPPAQP